MKLSVEIELDWIEEDGSIDEEIKRELVQGVKNAIRKSCMADMETKSKAAFSEAVHRASEKIDAKAISFAEEWLNKGVYVTDKWGDVKDSGTISDMIKRSFDNLLERRVDANGKFTSDSYGSKFKLIEFLTKHKVEQEVAERLKGFQNDMDKKIDAAINAGIKSNVSDRFAQMVIGAARQDFAEQKALESKQ
jgi:N-acetylglucosamine kinase-like BadF-type ATPase